VSRDELVREAVRALHGCLEPEKELDLENTTIAVVGIGERFHILEGEEVAPFIAGLGAAAAPGAVGAAGEEEEKEEEAEGKEGEAPASNAAGEGGAA
jgi:20S proteasome subunit alpha 6